MSKKLEDYIPLVQESGVNTAKSIVSSGTNTWSGTNNFTGAVTFTGSKSGGTQNVVTGGATLTAAQSTSLCVFDTAAGELYTLPAPTAGLSFDFFVKTTVTSSNHKVITNAGTVFLLGAISYGILDTTPGANPGPKFTAADGATHVAITMNGSTTGGLFGTYFTIKCLSSTIWAISGLVIASGTIATPFATS